ncbi:MAG: hypothetical protein HC815_32575 [Richelia sp. RM1_1_1]|nr:hypothetical protein [Richelia sp. RM1_1_1]
MFKNLVSDEISPGASKKYDCTLPGNHFYAIKLMHEMNQDMLKVHKECFMEIYDEHYKKVAVSDGNGTVQCYILVRGYEPINIIIYVFRERALYNCNDQPMKIKIIAFEQN